MKNSQERKELEIIYGLRDMLTGLKADRLDFHHLEKKEHGGKATLDNGALLERLSHDWLHSLEHSDIELFHLINDCLKLYKKCLDLNNCELINQYEFEVQPKVLKRIRGIRR